jgi:hypothetical protein
VSRCCSSRVNNSNEAHDAVFYREAAKEYFQNSPFFGVWDPAVIESYTQFGLLPDHERGGVKLKMSGFNVSEILRHFPNLMATLTFRWYLIGSSSIRRITRRERSVGSPPHSTRET